jgi:hypothetical protein
MRKFNYDLLALLGITLLLGLLLGAYITNELKMCDSVVYSKVEYRDSIVVKDTITITLIKGKPTKVKQAKFTVTQNVTLNDTVNDAANLCLDTNYYETFSFHPDSFRARMTATVTANELIDVSVEFKNLKPDIIKIVERTNTIEKKQSLLKVYAGLYGGVALKGQTLANYRGGVTFDAIISDKHLIGLNGGINNNLQPEIGIRFSEKIRLGK